jgi:hypothetical protein
VCSWCFSIRKPTYLVAHINTLSFVHLLDTSAETGRAGARSCLCMRGMIDSDRVDYKEVVDDEGKPVNKLMMNIKNYMQQSDRKKDRS